MEKLCGNCSTPFRHGDRFCRKCGAELPKTQQSNPERKGLINLALESYIIDSDTLRNHRDRERIGYINLVYGLAVIKAYAFSECKNLKSISIPASVERIESHAFSHCSSLKTVYYKGTKEQRKAMKIGSNDELTNAKWIYEPQPPDVRPEDGDRCPKCDGYIINGVCDRCGLDTRRASGSIAAPSPKPVKEDSNEYTQKRNQASVERKMAPAESGKSLVIGDRTPHLNRFDIPNRTSLTEITITENVTRIGAETFANCTSLTSITIPDSVACICDCAFKNCTHLTQIVLPVGLKTIGHHLFWGCERLESITIPAGITRIDGYAFHKCAALKTVHYSGTQTQKEQIKIADGNDCLLNAEWIYEWIYELQDLTEIEEPNETNASAQKQSDQQNQKQSDQQKREGWLDDKTLDDIRWGKISAYDSYCWNCGAPNPSWYCQYCGEQQHQWRK